MIIISRARLMVFVLLSFISGFVLNQPVFAGAFLGVELGLLLSEGGYLKSESWGKNNANNN